MVKIGDKLKEAGIQPKKSLGQNFLVNEGIYKKIVEAVSAKSSDTIVEVGPGFGILTDHLLETGAKIIAVEKDDKLFEYLQKKYSGNKQIEIVHEDILKFNPRNRKLEIGNWKLVGNIPYYLTSHLIQTVFETWSRSPGDRGSSTQSGPSPESIVFMIQKEVAKRIVASPPHSNLSVGASRQKMSLLSVAVQYFAVPKIICYVSKGSFYPMPKVDSAIIRLTPRTADNQQRIANSETEKFFRVVKAGFSNKRKQLGNNLAAAFHLSKKEIDAKLLMSGVAYERRAEILTLKEWQKISNIF